MVLKSEWEKTDSHTHLKDETIQAMVAQALPSTVLLSYQVISGGCANLNIKLSLRDYISPLLLRVYFRDQTSAYIEQEIFNLIHADIPIPKIHLIKHYENYCYGISEFKDGIPLRDLILNYPAEDIKPVMYETGTLLAKFQNYCFPQAGFFDKDLAIKQVLYQDNYVTYAQECLEHPTTKQQLDIETLYKIRAIFEEYKTFFPSNQQSCLVHGDYDPANILVNKSNSIWKVSAILDWEFAFAGSWLCDVSLMLRYAHKLPKVFEQSFLQGLDEAGLSLPNDWDITVNLLNLVSLLYCLVQCPPTKRPNQCADLCQLITRLTNCLSYSNLSL